MRWTAFFLGVLLCANSLRVDAGVKSTWLREAMRAAATKVGVSGKAMKSALVMPVAIIAACASFYACERRDFPSYTDFINASGETMELGIGKAESARYSNPDIWKNPVDYDGRLVLFRQSGTLETGIGSVNDNLEHNELEVVGVEQKNRRTIIKVWQVKGVLMQGSDNVGSVITVLTDDTMRRATESFREDRAARQILSNKGVTLSGGVVDEFVGVNGANWLLFVPQFGTGFPVDEPFFGVKPITDLMYLLTTEDKAISLIKSEQPSE